MHDFLIAKEIIDNVIKILKERKIEKVKKVELEVGTIALAHDGHPEHAEDVSVDNLLFGLKSISIGTEIDGADFSVTKIDGDYWKIKNIIC